MVSFMVNEPHAVIRLTQLRNSAQQRGYFNAYEVVHTPH